MNALNFRAPSTHIQDRSGLDAMVSDWIAKNGEPRRFERGFSGEWFNLRGIMLSLGYEISMDRRFYIVAKVGAKGRPKRMERENALRAIDEILIANGKEPFLRRTPA